MAFPLARDALERPSRCGVESRGKLKSPVGKPMAVSPPGSSEPLEKEESSSLVDLAGKLFYVHRWQSIV